MFDGTDQAKYAKELEIQQQQLQATGRGDDAAYQVRAIVRCDIVLDL